MSTNNPPVSIDPNLLAYIDARLTQQQERLQEQFATTVSTALNDALHPLQERIAALSPDDSRPSRLKVNSPPDFDGSRTEGEGFKKSCTLYMMLRSADFDTTRTATAWILSYMTEGRAQAWRDDQLEYLHVHESFPWDTMEAFWTMFDTEFTPVAESQEAIVKLEGRSYFQKTSESVDAYIDGFRQLVKKAQLQDKPSIVLKFRRGLLESLGETLSNSSHPPAADNVEQWYERARDLERNRIVQRTIHGNTVKPFSNSRPNLAAGIRPRPDTPSTAAPIPRTVPNPTPQSTPMDVDAARNRNRRPLPSDVCHRCKQPGHWASSCPLRFDIRHMTADEMENELALARDRADASHADEPGDEPESGQNFGMTSG